VTKSLADAGVDVSQVVVTTSDLPGGRGASSPRAIQSLEDPAKQQEQIVPGSGTVQNTGR
jgi:hypothetical protein